MGHYKSEMEVLSQKEKEELDREKDKEVAEHSWLLVHAVLIGKLGEYLQDKEAYKKKYIKKKTNG